MSYTDLLSIFRKLCCCCFGSSEVNESNDSKDSNVSQIKKEMVSFENPLFDIDDFDIITPNYINELENSKEDIYIPENTN